LVRRYSPEFADRGDVRVTPSWITDAFERIEAAAKRIHDAGVIPITMGAALSLCHYFAPLPPDIREWSPCILMRIPATTTMTSMTVQCGNAIYARR
jgi:hypothetical protein